MGVRCLNFVFYVRNEQSKESGGNEKIEIRWDGIEYMSTFLSKRKTKTHLQNLL
jgi:hypothetical protein